jgi:transposase
MRRFDTHSHRFSCGIDLQARTLALGIRDAPGAVAFRGTIAAAPQASRQALAPYRDDLAIACECMFAWYWRADCCHQENLPFVLGHALYLKAIHGGQAKNDKSDAEKIARLLRGGNLPPAYVYPKAMRATRDLLRRRTFLVRRRAELLAPVVNTNSPYNLPPLAKKLSYAVNRAELDGAARFTDPSVRQAVAADLTLIDAGDEQIRSLEWYLTRTAKVDDPQASQRLRSVPGVGPVLALVLLYEIHDVRRFAEGGPFLSYARLVRCAPESAGKQKGAGGTKIGNAHWKGAFAEATCLFLRASEQAKHWLARREKKRGQARALGAFAARRGRAVYHVLRQQEAFDATRFFASCRRTTAGVAPGELSA